MLAVIRLLTSYFSGEIHMVPCLLLPMIVLKLHSVPVKYSVIFVHFATVNFLIGQSLDLQVWGPLYAILSVMIEYLHKKDKHVFIIIVAANIVAQIYFRLINYK